MKIGALLYDPGVCDAHDGIFHKSTIRSQFL